jgi:hypothetical protein
MVRTLMDKLGRAAVRPYVHGMFAALVPPSCWSETEAAGEAEQLAAALAGGGLPVRHAGSFGFDFVAADSFFDTGANRHLLRVAMADLPSLICARITDRISDWWARRWRTRAALTSEHRRKLSRSCIIECGTFESLSGLLSNRGRLQER